MVVGAGAGHGEIGPARVARISVVDMNRLNSKIIRGVCLEVERFAGGAGKL